MPMRIKQRDISPTYFEKEKYKIYW